METKISKKVFISAKLKTLTGLHIGGTETGIDIGGLDKGAVIRDSVTNEPYIPGSSLKGKLRALLEKLRGEYEIDKDGKAGPSKDPAHLSAKIFGISADESTPDKNNGNQGNENKSENIQDHFFRSSRLIVRDAFLESKSRGKLVALNLELPFTEVKTETSIDRVTSKANPRSIERVPKDTEFEVAMILTVYDGDDEKELINGLFTAMVLLQEDYLGGHGSRGSGKIKFTIDTIKEKTNGNYLDGKNESDSAIEIPNEFK